MCIPFVEMNLKRTEGKIICLSFDGLKEERCTCSLPPPPPTLVLRLVIVWACSI
jgi:hypothetical protein